MLVTLPPNTPVSFSSPDPHLFVPLEQRITVDYDDTAVQRLYEKIQGVYRDTAWYPEAMALGYRAYYSVLSWVETRATQFHERPNNMTYVAGPRDEPLKFECIPIFMTPSAHPDHIFTLMGPEGIRFARGL